jgi:hypothetical protein
MANTVVAKIITIDTVDPQTDLDNQLAALGIRADRFLGAITIKLKTVNEKAEICIIYDDTV